MSSPERPRLPLMVFLRTPSIARSVTLLLASALVLLLAVNMTTFLMIQRTAHFNEEVERLQTMRRAGRGFLILVARAETAQRGFLLTAQPGLIVGYESDKAQAPRNLAEIDSLAAGEAETTAAVEALTRLIRAKFDEMDRTLALTRQGQIGVAIQQVRSGDGQRLMEEITAEVSAFDRSLSDRIDAQTGRSECAARLTATINAVAAILILVLAGISAMLIRRYIGDLNAARAEIDRTNAGLEEQIQARTAALVRANEEVQRFAYIVSHDLRSPLVNIMGYTSELEQAGITVEKAIAEAEKTRPVDPEVTTAIREDVPEAIGFIRASTEKMDRLINAILRLSREGRRGLAPETLDMTALVERIADTVRHQLGAAGAEIEVQSLPDFVSDRLAVEQVLGNLIDNAVKYLDAGRPGRIEVSGDEVAGGWVEYRVRDNGRGISERDHERIFELFRRSGRQDRPGEGLGLAFVRNSVRRLGGSIDVQSTLGQGSTFTLKFPKRLILAEGGDYL